MDTATSSEQRDTGIPWDSVIARINRVRRSLLYVVIVLLGGTAVSWSFADRAFEFLALPLTEALAETGRDTRLAYTSLTEPFVIYFTVAMLGGFLLTLPVLMTLFWRLVAPLGLARSIVKAGAFVIIATGLFFLGLAFGYLILLPFVVSYLLDVAAEFEYLVTVREYLKFALRMLLAMGISAQLPLISFVLARFGIVTPRQLLRWLPYAVLASFVLAAVITPPDGISQVLVAVPMISLYLIGVVVATFARPRR